MIMMGKSTRQKWVKVVTLVLNTSVPEQWLLFTSKYTQDIISVLIFFFAKFKGSLMRLE